MEFETVVYLKDLNELEKAYISKRMNLFGKIEAIIILVLCLFLFCIIDDFMNFSNLMMLFCSIALLLYFCLLPVWTSRKLGKTLFSLSVGQETIVFRYAFRNQYFYIYNLNTGKKAEFLISDVVTCKETDHYLIYFFSNKTSFYVEKSMKELQAFKQLFHPKKYYNLQKH